MPGPRPPPWEIALGLRLGIGPVATGILVAAVLLAGAVLFHSVVASGLAELREFVPLGFATRASVVAAVTTGYVFFATRFGALAGYADMRALGLAGEIDLGRDEAVVFDAAPSVLWQSRCAGSIGVAFFLLMLELPSWVGGGGVLGAWRDLHVLVYLQFLGIIFFWVAGRAAFFSLQAMRSLARIAAGSLPIDLFDLRSLRVFGRAAVRNCLLWLIGTSLGSLVLLNPELDLRSSLIVFIPILAVTLTIAGLALWLPVRGVHKRVAALRAAELARVEAALRGEPGALVGSRIEERGSELDLADLLAYRSFVAGVRSLPFEGPALGRIALFVLIPIGSWVGGALVERAVEAMLR
jgi:hypothetical protein